MVRSGNKAVRRSIESSSHQTICHTYGEFVCGGSGDSSERMHQKRHRLQFPRAQQGFEQDEAFFYLNTPEGRRRLRFHDYDQIYRVPGLYEQLFYDRLKCTSPRKVCDILKATVAQAEKNMSELRVLDLGAGNGMVGELLKGFGVSRIIGVDIIPEAMEAAERDRPGVYDDYYVADMTRLTADEREDMASWSMDCLVSVAALGFGDIPVLAFVEAFNLLQAQGWVAFNIKETFLDNSDTTGFSRAIRELIFSQYLDLYHLERYRHRLSIVGEPLFYFALAGRKNADIPGDFLQNLGV